MDYPSQLSSHVQVRNLAFAGGASNGINLTGFSNVLFAVNFGSAGPVNITLESSPDNVNWSPVIPSYFTNSSNQYPTANVNTEENVFGTLASPDQFVFLSLNRPQPGMVYFRVSVSSGTPSYGVALVGNALLSAPAQPDLGIAEFKGTF